MTGFIRNRLVKSISWILLLHFLVVYVFSDYAYAAKYVKQEQNISRGDHIQIPFGYGKVIERYRRLWIRPGSNILKSVPAGHPGRSKRQSQRGLQPAVRYRS